MFVRCKNVCCGISIYKKITHGRHQQISFFNHMSSGQVWSECLTSRAQVLPLPVPLSGTGITCHDTGCLFMQNTHCSLVGLPLMVGPPSGPIELFLVPATAPQLVYIRLWSVFSCLVFIKKGKENQHTANQKE